LAKVERARVDLGDSARTQNVRKERSGQGDEWGRSRKSRKEDEEVIEGLI
jgi:hypothetical protein